MLGKKEGVKMKKSMDEVKRDLSHIFWIGGPDTSGKTTVSDNLSEKYGFRVYHQDEYYPQYRKRAVPTKHPALCEFFSLRFKMTIDEIYMMPWEEFVKICSDPVGEVFEMIIDDLYSFPKNKPLIFEGSFLYPEIYYQIVDYQKAVWIFATDEFRRMNWIKHDYAKERMERSKDPELLFENMLFRNGKRAEDLLKEAKKMRVKVITVDEKTSIPETLKIVEEHFGLKNGIG